jgi:hypothetical protein
MSTADYTLMKVLHPADCECRSHDAEVHTSASSAEPIHKITATKENKRTINTNRYISTAEQHTQMYPLQKTT